MSIAVGDRIAHNLVPDFVMEVLEAQPCEQGTGAHSSYRIIDPEGQEDWLCEYDVHKVEG